MENTDRDTHINIEHARQQQEQIVSVDDDDDEAISLRIA
jgi:hypothetical protein